MTEKRQVTERRALLRNAAAEKSEGIYERITGVVDQVHLIVTDGGFANVLRAEGVQSIPGCLRRLPSEEIGTSTLKMDRLDEISLEFVVVWKFLFPLLKRPAVESHVKKTWPDFIPQFKDAFIALVTEGPFPNALSGHVGTRRGPRFLRRGRRRGATQRDRVGKR